MNELLVWKIYTHGKLLQVLLVSLKIHHCMSLTFKYCLNVLPCTKLLLVPMDSFIYLYVRFL